MRKLHIIIGLLYLSLSLSIMAGEIVLEPSGYLPVKSQIDGPVNKFFVNYSIPDSLDNKLVVLAFLEIETELDTTIADNVTISAYPLTETWTSSATPSVETSVLKNDTLISYLHQDPNSQEKLKFDVTELVMRWVEGRLDNYGFVVLPRSIEDKGFDVKKSGGDPIADLRIFYENITVE